MFTFIASLILILGFTFVYVAILYKSDTRKWNNGRCPCGGKWKFTGLTVSGSRIYECEYCDNETVIVTCDIK